MLSFIGSATVGVVIIIVALAIFGKNGKGPLARLFNIGRGKTDRAIEEAEKNDPDAIFRIAIQEAEEALIKIDKGCQELKGLEFEERGKMEKLGREHTDLEKMLNVALEQEEEDLGAEIFGKVDSVKTQIEACREQAAFYKSQADDMNEIRTAKKKELEELKVEQKTSRSVQTAAEAVDKIRRRQQGLANDAISKGLESARSGIASRKASLQANREIKSNSLESRMSELKRKGAESSNKDKFKEMLAARKGSNQ